MNSIGGMMMLSSGTRPEELKTKGRKNLSMLAVCPSCSFSYVLIALMQDLLRSDFHKRFMVGSCHPNCGS